MATVLTANVRERGGGIERGKGEKERESEGEKRKNKERERGEKRGEGGEVEGTPFSPGQA
ncbi:UNVERIFIED_CONTAM: hypothetical protein FKN15_062040 [Acipenser sinensis]